MVSPSKIRLQLTTKAAILLLSSFIILFVSIVGAVPPSYTYPGFTSTGSWQPTFSEDFNYSSINGSNFTKNWNIRSNESHCEPCEPELYVASALSMDNDTLVVATARSHTLGPDGQIYNFTSGWVDTKGKFSQMYGLFEAKAKLPGQNSTGIWPAFWTLPESNDCWPTQGEIDVFEYTANFLTNDVFGSYRWGTSCGNDNQVLPGAGYPSSSGNTIDWSADFHTFAVIWNSSSINFYVDGNWYETKNSTKVNLPTVPHYVILDTAIAWYWMPDSNAVYPATTVWDYVHVYQWIQEE